MYLPGAVRGRLSTFEALAGAVALAVLAGIVCIRLLAPDPNGIVVGGNIFFDGDHLQFAALVQDLATHPDAITGFELPRSPSIFPDLALFALARAITSAWPFEFLLYAWVSLLALMLCGGRIAAMASGRATSGGLMLFSAVSVTAILGSGVLGQERLPSWVLLPTHHGGQFVLSLAAFCLVAAHLDRMATMRHAGLLALVIAGTVSDRLFLTFFTGPFLVGIGYAVLTRQLIWRDAALIVGNVAIATLIGFAVDHLLYRQPILAIEWSTVPEHFIAAWAALPAYFAQHALYLGLWIWLPGLAAVVLWPIIRLRNAGWAWRQYDPVAFWCLIGVSASLPGMLIVLLVYQRTPDLRYGMAAMWWPGILGTALAMTLFGRAAKSVSAAAVALASLAAILVTIRGHPALAWPPPITYPLAACIRQSPEMEGLRTGLAEYWVARPLQAASNWQWQVDQIRADGMAQVWGNDRWNYVRDIHDAGHPPSYRFVVLRNLDAKSIRDRYGAPDRIVNCPESDIWLYDQPTHLQSVLAATSSDLLRREGDLGPPTCVPGPMFSSVKRTEEGGAPVVVTDSHFDAHATWGPYIDLPAGDWTITLVYRLTLESGARAEWDVASGVGAVSLHQAPLPASGEGFTSVAARIASNEPIPALEARTHLIGAATIELAGLEVRKTGAGRALSCGFSAR